MDVLLCISTYANSDLIVELDDPNKEKHSQRQNKTKMTISKKTFLNVL